MEEMKQEENQIESSAPVVEKVSLEDIQQEKKQGLVDKVMEIILKIK